MQYFKKIQWGVYTGGMFLLLFFFTGALMAFAQEGGYTPLVAIPGFDEGSTSIPDFVNTVYKLTLALGALLGVIKIAIAGVKYSVSDVVTDKSDARKDILGVLLGLAILLMPYIVLSTIHPDLLNLNFTEQIKNPGFRQVEQGNQSTTVTDGDTRTLTTHCHEGGFWGSPMSDADCRAKCKNLAEKDHDFVAVVSHGVINTPVYQNPSESRKSCKIVYEVRTQ